MDSHSLIGGFTDAPAQAARAFRAAMEAMARPGRIEQITGAAPPAPLSPAAGALILTLCDPDTPLYLAGACDTAAVRDWVTFHTGAPITGAATCAFAVGTWDDLLPLGVYPAGTAENPHQSATLFAEVSGLMEQGSILTGPGIETTATLSLPDLTGRDHAFPLGLDIFWTCGDRLAALPRSTKVSPCM